MRSGEDDATPDELEHAGTHPTDLSSQPNLEETAAEKWHWEIPSWSAVQEWKDWSVRDKKLEKGTNIENRLFERLHIRKQDFWSLLELKEVPYNLWGQRWLAELPLENLHWEICETRGKWMIKQKQKTSRVKTFHALRNKTIRQSTGAGHRTTVSQR